MKAKKERQIKSDGWNKKEEEEEGRPSRESLKRACSQTEKQTGVAPPAATAAAIHIQSQIDGRHIGVEKKG